MHSVMPGTKHLIRLDKNRLYKNRIDKNHEDQRKSILRLYFNQ